MKRNLLFGAMFVCFSILLAGRMEWMPASVRVGAAITGLVLLVIALVTDAPRES
jgi:hypothetical protein